MRKTKISRSLSVIFFVVLALNLFVLPSSTSGVHAQSAGEAEISPPDTEDYPNFKTNLKIYDFMGMFIHNLKEELLNDPPFPAVCEIVLKIISSMDDIWVSLYDFADLYLEYPLIFYILYRFATIVAFIITGFQVPIIILAIIFQCVEWPPWWPWE